MYKYSNSKGLLFVVVASVLLGGPSDSTATVVEIYTTADTYVDACNPSVNYGGDSELDVGISDTGTARCRSFLKFDLSAIPAGSVITNAALTMEATSFSSSDPLDVGVHNVDYLAWAELILTWDMPPSYPPIFHPTPTDVVSIGGVGFFSWNVTNDIILAADGAGIYSAAVKLVDDDWEEGNEKFIRFRARESDFPAKLTVVYSPPAVEPVDPPWDGTVTHIEWEDNYVYIEADNGHVVRTRTYDLPEENYTNIDYEWAGEGERELVAVLDPCTLMVIVQIDYDVMGRVEHCSSEPQGSTSEGITEVDFSYDVLGNLTGATVGCPNGGSVSWSLGTDPNDNFEKRIYEKKNGSGSPSRFGIVDYFIHDPNEKLTQTIQGYTGAAELYQYDANGRLTAITQADSTVLREYLYDQNDMLETYNDYEDPNHSCSYDYELSSVGLLTEISSQTSNSDPNYVRLGKLTLSYNSNKTLQEVGYSTDEAPMAPITPMYSTNYTYDGLDRRIRAHYISHDPNVPSVIVTMDPNGPETSSHMVTQYIYDSLGRLAWSVDTCGYVTRTIYNQAAGLEEEAMLQIHMEEPNELYITSYERNSSPSPVGSTDLQGHFVRYDYDTCGNQRGSYVLGAHGGGGSGGGAYGQVFQMFAYNAECLSPGESLPRYGWDQYGDVEIIIEEGDVGANGEEMAILAVKKKAKKKITPNKKITKEKQAKEKRRGCTERLKGDVNGDCLVNLRDLAELANDWLIDVSY